MAGGAEACNLTCRLLYSVSVFWLVEGLAIVRWQVKCDTSSLLFNTHSSSSGSSTRTHRTHTERTLQGLDGLLKQLREMLLQGMKSVLREVNLSYRCVMRLFQAANALALLQVVCWKLTRTSMLDAHTHEQKHAQAHAWECTHTHARTRCSAVFEDACGDEREKCAALLPGVQLVRQEARHALLDLLKAQVRGCVAGCVLRAVWLAAGCVAACCVLRAARCRSSALLDLLKA